MRTARCVWRIGLAPDGKISYALTLPDCVSRVTERPDHRLSLQREPVVCAFRAAAAERSN